MYTGVLLVFGVVVCAGVLTFISVVVYSGVPPVIGVIAFAGIPPVIEPFNQQPVVREGSRAKLVCRVSGNPRPFILWYRQGILLPISELPR